MKSYNIQETRKGFVVTYTEGHLIQSDGVWTAPTLDDALNSIRENFKQAA